MERPGISLRNRHYVSKFARFIVVGASNTAISFFVFMAMLAVLPDGVGMSSVAQAISYGAGIAWSFFWNRRWVFDAPSGGGGQAFRFVALQLSLLLLSTATIGLAVDYLGVHPVISWFVVMALVTVLNFLALKRWVFR